MLPLINGGKDVPKDKMDAIISELLSIHKIDKPVKSVSPKFYTSDKADVVMIDLGLAHLVTLPKSVVQNFLRDYAITLKDFQTTPMDLIAVDGMRINNVLGIDILMTPSQALVTDVQPIYGKVTINPATIPFDQNGNVTIGATVVPLVTYKIAEPVPVFGFACSVTPYNSLSGLTKVKFTYGDWTAEFQLQNSVGRFAFGLPIPVNNVEAALQPAVVGGGIDITGAYTLRPFNKVFEFDPLTVLAGRSDDVVFEGVNANVVVYPLILEQSSKTALLNLWADRRLQDLMKVALSNIK